MEWDCPSVRLQMRDDAVRHKERLHQSCAIIQSSSSKMDALTFWLHLTPIRDPKIMTLSLCHEAEPKQILGRISSSKTTSVLSQIRLCGVFGQPAGHQTITGHTHGHSHLLRMQDSTEEGQAHNPLAIRLLCLHIYPSNIQYLLLVSPLLCNYCVSFWNTESEQPRGGRWWSPLSKKKKKKV